MTHSFYTYNISFKIIHTQFIYNYSTKYIKIWGEYSQGKWTWIPSCRIVALMVLFIFVKIKDTEQDEIFLTQIKEVNIILQSQR